MLEARLQELDSVVDKFVLVESPRTFSGQPKPLHFKDNRARFAAFSQKIVYIELSDVNPPDFEVRKKGFESIWTVYMVLQES